MIAAVNVDTSIYSGSVKYKLLTVIPNDYNKSKKYSLVVGLQPCGWDIQTYRGSLKSLTDSLKMIVVCPYVHETELTNWGIVKASIDSAKSIYNIDTTSVYLTGMSCNGDYVLQNGLKNLYPFKGIFPWAPWVPSINPKLYNFNTKVPVVLSIGTLDDNYNVILAFYDSLKKHNANVNLIIEQGIAHELVFNDIGNLMVKSVKYLNDTNPISINKVDDVNMISNETKEVVVKYKNNSANKIKLKVQSSNISKVPTPKIVSQNGDSIVISISPAITISGKFYIIVEAADSVGTSIEQTTFHVNVTKFVDVKSANKAGLFDIYPNPTSSILNLKINESNSILQIFDITGKIIVTKSVYHSNEIINVENFPKGIYFIKLTGKNTNETIKFIVK